MDQPVYLVCGKRTPQVKAGMDLADVDAPYLGSSLLRHLLDKTSIPDDQIDCVIVGNTGNPPKYPNIGRVIALEGGLDKKTEGSTVHRNCASGMEALAQGFLKVASGRNQLLFAGGVESMSQMPFLYGKKMKNLFIEMMKARTLMGRLKALSSFRLSHLTPVVALEVGLTDPFCGMNMGMTAELLAREFSLSREEQDEYANNSHHKAVSAQEEGKFQEEILPITVGEKIDKIICHDIGPRKNSSVKGLAKMRPYFDRKTGTVTVGNSCPITDGGSMWLMAGEKAVEKYSLTPMARMVDFHFHGLEPERMGMGPLMAMHGILERTNMTLDQMDLIEINEAFAAQVLAVIKGCTEKKFAAKFGLDKLLGEVPMEKLNVNGGAVALGHPVGSTGSRMIVTLATELKRRSKKYGIASMCIGGGQGGAVIIENLS